jgi:methyl-accepting chemotaxis protein
MADAPATPAPANGRHRRHIRNYLLDRRFQLKYAGYFVAVALVLSGALGGILWTTAKQLLVQSRSNVEKGREVVAEGRKVSQVVEMNIVKDPDYSGDPALLQAFRDGDQNYVAKLAAQQAALEAQARELESMYAASAEILVGALGLFVVLVALGSILVTHRVAGPVYKMKRLIGEVAEGRLREPGKLRRGDELVEFFTAFDSMLRALRSQQQADLAELEQALSALSGQDEPAALVQLSALRDRLRGRLGQ